jgi:prepilin-type N-terminal cleavage/methylation domain-containing protein
VLASIRCYLLIIIIHIYMMFTKVLNRKKGFTLIELLVVIAIIGILSSVVLASLSTARQKSRDAKRISDLGQVQLALELYFDASQSYPRQAAAATVALPAALTSGNYIPNIPATPTGALAYQYMGLFTTTAGVASTECTTVVAIACAAATSYDLTAELERYDNTTLVTDADLVTVTSVITGTSLTCAVAQGAAAGGAQTSAGVPTGERCYDLKP